MSVLMTIIGILVFTTAALSQSDNSYLDYDELTTELKQLVAANKGIAQMESIGKTLEGRDLWVV
ncbi:MAG: hypothetical protein R3182_08600, partial [Draconibacterium sp.]|nr:hypothetical protein [Draconibacterium sp.]